MQSIPYFEIARLLVGLAAGFWLTRKMRGLIRGVVVRLMPVRYRVSEQSFDHQTRLSTMLAYLVALGIAVAVHLALGKASRALNMPWVKKEEQTMVRSTPLEQPAPTPPPVYEPAPPPAVPTEYAAPEPPAAQEAPARPTAYHGDESFYLQLYAFQSEARAWQQQQYWQGRLSLPVQVGIAPGEGIPYKVVVGPFSSRADARRYGRSQRLEGFPRPHHGIRLYQD